MKPAPHRSDYCSTTSLAALAVMPCWASLIPPQRLALREYLKAVDKSERMSRKAADDFGMGRRRSTTNAANWSTYAGQRDRLEKNLIETGVPLSRIIEIEAEWRKITKIRTSYSK
jgi:hypothetical protein